MVTPSFPHYDVKLHYSSNTLSFPSPAGHMVPPSFPHYDFKAQLAPVNSKPDPRIKVRLENEVLWNQFDKFGTEMIITKLGR